MARRFILERLPVGGVGVTGDHLCDRRGRRREFGDVRRAVSALIDAGENPDEWRVWHRDVDRIAWKSCPGSARDAVYVMTGRVI
jgi:hypothetical protein